MIKVFGRRPPKVDPDELNRQTAEVNAFIDEQSPKMSAVAKWLINRSGQNGFGEDFDITCYPREI